MTDTVWRWPAEWEPQSAILMAWPHAGTDWAPRLAAVEPSFVALGAAIARFQTVIICVADSALQTHAAALLERAGALMERVRFVQVPYDDTWLRDSGPLTLSRSDAEDHPEFCLLDFRFTAWGGKFDASRDDALVASLIGSGLFKQDTAHQRIDWALEGGAVESDGAGTVLTTWHCLTQRHPQQSRAEMEAVLCSSLAAKRVLWLDHGELQGDDTDAHIDTLARLAPGDAIVYQSCDDPDDPHHAELSRMAGQLGSLRTADGQSYRLHALPWPAPVIDAGRRLPASYANYLILNDAVLMPTYDDPADGVAAQVIAGAHPGREVVGVPCRPVIWQNGSLHCLTMQLPAGLVA